ncbi:MAG: VUT family protein [Caulobacteraceae bacterium]
MNEPGVLPLPLSPRWTNAGAAPHEAFMTIEQAFAFLQQWHVAVPIVLATMAAFFFAGRRWTALYVGLMPFINWSFAAVETYPIPAWLGGGLFQPLAIVTGLVLVVRDFAQREMKHWIWAAMIVGLILSTLTSWITVVVASGLAFLISETVDWVVYTLSRRPLSQRIMISSLVSAPLDQIVFIGLASLVVPGIFAWGTILTGIASKLLGAWVVSRAIAAQEHRSEPQNDMNPA